MKQCSVCHAPHPRALRFRDAREHGFAVITALLLVTLALTAVTNLFWLQQLQVRSIENQRLQWQQQWILRGAVDWSRLILREDARFSQADALDEPWAVPLTATRLDQLAESGSADTDTMQAALTGVIVDAQSRYNLTNLSAGGKINSAEVAVFQRLLINLELNPGLALPAAQAIATARAPASSTKTDDAPRPLPIIHVDDFLAVPGFSQNIVATLREFVVVLPRATPVNLNTAPAEVLAARFESLSVADAAVFVAARSTASFRDMGDASHRLPGRLRNLTAREVAVTSSYFLVQGTVRTERGSLMLEALVERNGNDTQLLWVRQN